MKQLPPGQGWPRTWLYDKCWRLLWDSAVDTTPAYRHISDWCNAVIAEPDGRRWQGQFYRCREGIRRVKYTDAEYLKDLLKWPEPFEWTDIHFRQEKE